MVESGGVAAATTVESGGLEVISGEAEVAQINAGGSMVVESGGGVSDYTIESGGLEVISAGGVDAPLFFNGEGATDITAGGSQVVENGGLASGTTVNGGEQDVFGTASGATVFAGSQVGERRHR